MLYVVSERGETGMSSESPAVERRVESAPVYKSTPLRPAIIMTSVFVWALVVALILRVPAWASVFLAILTGASFLVFMVGYVYLFARDRESLRTGPARRAVSAAQLDVETRGVVAPGGVAPPELREPAVIPVLEAERTARHRP